MNAVKSLSRKICLFFCYHLFSSFGHFVIQRHSTRFRCCPFVVLLLCRMKRLRFFVMLLLLFSFFNLLKILSFSELDEIMPALTLTKSRGQRSWYTVDDYKLKNILGFDFRYRFANPTQMDFGYIVPGTLAISVAPRRQIASYIPYPGDITRCHRIQLPMSLTLTCSFTRGQANRTTFEASPFERPNTPEAEF